MAVLASNEKEEAWLDEGFVTFFEDEIADHYFGKKTSIFDVWGYKSGNRERSRLEYTSMDNIHDGPIARPGWEFNEGNFKALIYAKTATILQTLKGLVGENKFYTIIHNYYEKYKFTHPKEADFIDMVKATIGDSISGMSVDTFFHHTLHGTEFCDYYISNVSEVGFELQNHGKLFLPIEILITYTDGTKATLTSSLKSTSQFFKLDANKEIKSIVADPDHKLYLDVNFNNNSIIKSIEHKPSANFGVKIMAWFHFIFQSLSFFA
jgi:Peptidase family M1 domain